jgi:hypothetical protein
VSFRWQYRDGAGGLVPGPDAEFGEQAEAEDWLGGTWSELLESGVDQVVLTRDGTEIYPMSLHPPG